jgi:hypothetical protein
MTETPANDDVRIVLEHERRLLAPDASRGDLETLLHPDFSEVVPDGRRFGRSELITVLTSASSGRDLSPRMAADLNAVRLSGSAFLFTFVSEQGDRRARRATLWLRTGGGWRAYYHQSTPIQPSP